MDVSFMSRVSEHIAAATESVSSFSPTADPENLAAVQTMDEWMASHSPGSKSRCADCKAPLVEGSTKICLACGSLLPSGVTVRREPFSFGKSLAKKLFYESLHLEDPHDTSSDEIELELRPTSSGTKTITNGYSQQQPPSTPRVGVETDESILQGGERSKAIVSDASDSSIPPPAPSSSSKPLKEEEDEEYIWGSSDTDDFGLQGWTQQLARDSGGDPKEFASADHSVALHSANQILDQTLSTSDADFLAAVSISADQTLSQSVESDFNFFFPSAPNSVDHSGGEQLASTAGPGFSKELPGPSVGTGFHDFFQASHPTSGDQSLDPNVQTPDPFLRQASDGTTVGDNFDDFFQSGVKSADQSNLHDEKETIPFPGEVSSNYNIETDFDDFFQAVPKSVDHSCGRNVDKNPLPYAAEGTSGHKIETDFDGFFKAASGLGEQSGGLNLETPIPHITEESIGQDGEADFDDFLQAAPRSADQFGGSNQGDDLSRQREETLFDFFSNTSTGSASQGPKVEAAAAPHSVQEPGVQALETDFDFFFPALPVSGDQSGGQNIQTGGPHLAEKSISQEVNYFDDFFQAGHKSGDQDRSQNVEQLFSTAMDDNSSQWLRTDFDVFEAVPESANHPLGLQVETPITPTVDGSNGQYGEADFDDFFQAASVPTGNSRVLNIDGSQPNSAKGSGGENIETDFDDFFQAAPKSANGSGGHNGGTDFDYLFPTPQKSDGRVHGQYGQPGVPDNLAKSDGQIVEPDFDEFFQGANISINHSGQKVKTVTPNPAEDCVDQNGKTGFQDFFQAASYSVGQSNGHNTVTNFDFFKDAPHSVKEVLGQNASMGFDGFSSTPSHSVGNAQGKRETRDFDHFFEAPPLSVVESHEQNETTDLGSGEFDDFVQAAPQSADKAVNPSHTTEFDFFFQGSPGPLDVSQHGLTDVDEFLQVSLQTSDESSIGETRRQIDFLKASNQLADDSRSKKGSMNLENLVNVAPLGTVAPKSPINSPGFLVHHNGSGQTTQVEASRTSALTEGRSSNGSSNGDLLKQLEGLHLSQSSSEVYLEPSRKMPKDLSDLSFRLADHLVISDDFATNLWSLN